MAFVNGVLRFKLLVLLCALVTGCVDYSLAPRAYDINQGTQNLRESAILLNIVRASRSEPLNFVPLSKYTGTGSVSLSESFLKNQFPNPGSSAISQAFSSSASAGQGNAFDVGTLENKEFYGGFMSPLNLESLNLLLNAGLNKELVLHSVLDGFRVRLAGRSLLFVNNPDDDVPYNSMPCTSLYNGTESAFEPVASSQIWREPGACRYQKFLYFLRVAIRWGVTVEARASRTKSTGKGKSGSDDSSPVVQYFVCYDPAIALENGMGGSPDAAGACGSRNRDAEQTREFQFRFRFNTPIEGVAPVVRSPYAVFQYYGHLLANQMHEPVELSEISRRKDARREARLLTIEQGPSVDCFTETFYAGTRYCVPNQNSKNTKEAFVLLNTLVAISTNRSALPVTPTFVLTP
jgi:hypothetical protein